MVLFLLLLRKQEASEPRQKRLTKTNVGLTSLELNIMFLMGGLEVINSSKGKKNVLVSYLNHNSFLKRIEV